MTQGTRFALAVAWRGWALTYLHFDRETVVFDMRKSQSPAFAVPLVRWSSIAWCGADFRQYAAAVNWAWALWASSDRLTRASRTG